MSAGLLLYRLPGTAGRTELEVLIVHPGGPYFEGKDAGVWSVPKGEYVAGDDPLTEARREFAEETGFPLPATDPIDLGSVRQSNKLVRAFAMLGDAEASRLVSNECEVEWPSRSGRRITIPEVDRAEWVTPDGAAARLVAAQVEFVKRLEAELLARGDLNAG